MDGLHTKVIFKSTTHNPREIAVNPSKRYIYWLDYGQFPMLARANLDGTERKELVTTGISDPRDLTIDMLKDRIVHYRWDLALTLTAPRGMRDAMLRCRCTGNSSGRLFLLKQIRAGRLRRLSMPPSFNAATT